MELEINARTLAPIHCASTDPTRYNLNTLHWAADGSTVATNGHILARVVPEETQTPSGTSLTPLEPFALQLGALKSLQSEQRKKNAPMALLDCDATNVNGYARVVDGNGAHEIPKIEGDYPDWKQVQPKNPPHYSVALSVAVLEPLIAAARQFTGTRKGETVVVKFGFGEEDVAPAVAIVEHPDCNDQLELVLMPCRVQ